MNTHITAFLVEDMRIEVDAPGVCTRLTFEQDGSQISICPRDGHEKEDFRRIIQACEVGILNVPEVTT